MTARPTSSPLVHCRQCASPLLQLVDVAGPVDGLSIVARSCPECGQGDLIVAEHIAVELWQLRDARITTWMEASADAQAAALALAASAAGGGLGTAGSYTGL